MASPDLIQPVVVAAEEAAAKAGLTLVGDYKAQLIAWIEPLADADAKEAMDALAAHITLNGFASVMQTPIRNAITGSETDVASILNSNIEGGVDSVQAWLAKIAAPAA